MPVTTIFPDRATSTYDDNVMYVTESGIAGIRYDLDSPTPFPERFPEAEITLETIPIEALESVWAVNPVLVDASDALGAMAGIVTIDGGIYTQVSVDGGTTWLWWDGSSWSVAGATDWSSFMDVNGNLDTIPFGEPRSIRFKVRLVRGTDTHAAFGFAGILMGYTVVRNYWAEEVARTIKRMYDANLRLAFRTQHIMPSPTDYGYVSPTEFDLGFPLEGVDVSSAYDLTADPTRQNNIAVGLSASQSPPPELDWVNVLSLSSPPASGSLLEVNWSARVPVILHTPDFDLNDEKSRQIPALVVRVADGIPAPNRTSEVYGNYTINHATSKYYNEITPSPVDYRVQVFSVAADESLAIKIIDAAYELTKTISRERHLRLVKTGALAEIHTVNVPFMDMTNTTESLSVKVFEYILYSRQQFSTPRDGALAEDLRIRTTLIGDY